MNITPIKNLNFKSEIHVLCPYDYSRVTEIMSEMSNDYKNIFFWDIESADAEKYEKFKAYRTDCNLVSTEEIRSCTGYLSAEKGKKAPLTMHLYNSEENIKNLPKLEPYMRGTNAFVIGSKKKYEYSSSLFDKVVVMAKKKKLPITIMKNLSQEWQANFAYDANIDTIFLCINNIRQPNKFVQNMKELKKVFSKIQISPTDTIKFFCRK